MPLFVYVLARLSLIAQALTLLRRQLPSSFLAVDGILVSDRGVREMQGNLS